MNVSKNSWHYRLLLWHKAADSNQMPQNLCQYVRDLALMLLLLVFSTVVLVVFTIGIIFFWYSIISGNIPTDDQSLQHFLMIIGAVQSGIAFVVIVVLLVKFLIAKAKNLFDRSPRPKEESLVVEYLRAKHSKICPKIDFKE